MTESLRPKSSLPIKSPEPTEIMGTPNPDNSPEAQRLAAEYEKAKTLLIKDLLNKGAVQSGSIRDLLTESINTDVDPNKS